MPAEPEEELNEEPSGGKKPNKTVLIGALVAGMFLLQGIGVFVAVKLIGKGPAEAVAAELKQAQAHEGESADQELEQVKIASIEAPHTTTGQLFIIRMSIYATVPKRLLTPAGEEGDGEGEEKGETGIKAEIARHLPVIKDCMRTIISSADPGTLCLARAEKPDYSLSTLKRQFKSVLEEVLGKGKIKGIRIPEYMPTPMD